mmetsp:Transcript_41312/g.116944  ORF Transcript_41312/g.116944 Transcript_41312/m.116944 type:complete len:204 (-) Transcript_41312:122-733(-)
MSPSRPDAEALLRNRGGGLGQCCGQCEVSCAAPGSAMAEATWATPAGSVPRQMILERLCCQEMPPSPPGARRSIHGYFHLCPWPRSGVAGPGNPRLPGPPTHPPRTTSSLSASPQTRHSCRISAGRICHGPGVLAAQSSAAGRTLPPSTPSRGSPWTAPCSPNQYLTQKGLTHASGCGPCAAPAVQRCPASARAPPTRAATLP